SNEHRTSHTTSISFDFDQDLSHHFHTHASSDSMSLEHLTFAIYFIFLFKLTNGQTDLCIAMNINNNRSRDELKSIIGLFENVIPLRCQLDPHWYFHQLLEHVHQITTNSMKYSYFPLQRILNQHPHISKPGFLDISFEFLSSMTRNNNKIIMIGDSQLSFMPFTMDINDNEIRNKYDFSLQIQHDLDINQLTCTINASLDLFNVETIDNISQRFHFILHQLSASIIDNEISKPIYEISLTLPNERLLMQSLNNTQISFPSPLTCIHHEFVYQVMKHPQKLAVELDEQSLTYAELLYYAQDLSSHLIIGIVAIEMSGSAYCPLSPRDPQNRLHTLIEQTQSRLVLIHWLTRAKFHDNDTVLVDMHSILTNNNLKSYVDVNRLADVKVTPANIAYIIFTSGSTGVPKAVQVRHENFTHCMHSLININIFNVDDIVVQMARCSFDIHLFEIVGSLMVGAALVMLHPGGTMDYDYLSLVLGIKQVSYMDGVPSAMYTFLSYMQLEKKKDACKYLRCLTGGGESFSVKLATLIGNNHIQNCTVINCYGPAEATVNSTCHIVDISGKTQSISIGRPSPNYQCLILNEFLQNIYINEEGEMFVGGVGVFAGYLGRDDLTSKALVEIDGQLFYRTGDLVRMDSDGLLHYQGRKDHQIKLHGQRIELGEIERCLLNITSISACVVMKWNDDHLVAYAQSSSHMNEEQLRQQCQSHLPPHMIPSFFIILEKLPLNPNGKIDRKLLPPPDFLPSTDNIDGNVPRNTLEQQLQDIFSQAFHIESPHLYVPFGQLGGTSLGAILALTLIRQQICNKVDIGLLFTNPSIQQLAIAIEPMLAFEELQETASTVNEIHETDVRLTPSFVVESLGIALLICQWLLPIMIIHQWCPLLFPILPISHLLFYVICSRLISPQNIKDGNVFSWSYYRWWFLDRLWNNNTFWLQHILGTPFYNYYLRLCGARISSSTHINTTIMDAPWSVEIGDGTWIADQTFLNCFHFNDGNTFEIYSIKIGSNCSIGTRSILFDEVDMKDNIIVQPMSSVTGSFASKTVIDGEEHKAISSDDCITYNKRSLSVWHKIYQIIVLISLICIHCTILIFVYKIYSIKHIPLPIIIAFCWTLWSLIGCFVSIILLKFVAGSCKAGDTYSIASWSYLHKLWVRQLIVFSFRHAWLLPSAYDDIYPSILRWLGAHIEDNVKLSEINIFLSCPTNLLELETGVTTFGSVLIVPTELTVSGDHRTDRITFGAHTNLANGCTILPGSRLASETMVGNLTRISRETNHDTGDVFIGVPARVMPFKMPLRSNQTDQIQIIPIWHTCFFYFIGKCVLVSIYSLGGFIGGSVIHITLICGLHRWHSYIHHQLVQQLSGGLTHDFVQFICPFLGNTQWLVRLFRAFGAHIGEGVILPDFSCITDYHLITIGDNVRLNIHANIQCHSFEQRIIKLAPVTIKNSCVLMSGSFVMAGCKLMGNNRLYPFTLVMKNDLLLPNTQWKGLPAELLTTKTTSSQSLSVRDNKAEQQQISENVLAHVSLINQNVLEVSCGRGSGAVWCVHNYVPGSYVGVDLSLSAIDVCRQRHSMISRLSFVVADATQYLPFDNESLDIVLCVEATHAYGGPAAVQRFASEVARVLRPNGYFLWCDLLHIDGSDTSIDYLTANGELVAEEKINITRNVLHALDIQSNTRAEFIERYVRPREQEYFRLFAGLPGTHMYSGMYEGHIQYWRAVFRKKTTTDMTTI
ncbi:unnamed protein product, partial [Adineta steineri]